ncbi:MAG: MarR family transcriptional regulator [Muribaculaceae bacterium]|nr:MarR family transcriptional regulator [Muribaculaceae bacterium]MCF0182220.1 MarR family transcriptional regulator [Muribaculaceae bacterium]
MENVEIVLNKMKEINAPVNATALAAATGLDKKEVDKAMAILKKEEKIFSPVRCKWQAK